MDKHTLKKVSQRFLANVKGKIIPFDGRFYIQLHNLKRITNSGILRVYIF